MKGILPKLAQQKIELDTSIPPTHQTFKYKLNLNYLTTVKQDINKLLAKEDAQEKWKIENLCGFQKVK